MFKASIKVPMQSREKSIKIGVIRSSKRNSTIYFAHICTTASLQNISDTCMFCYSAIV